MSEPKGRRSQEFAKYDTMSTEDLQEILRQDANSPDGIESDTELLLYVMEVLANRRRNSENPGNTALEAYASFQDNYLYDEGTEEDLPAPDSEKSKVIRFSWLRRLGTIAAVMAIIFLGSITANAFGFWDIVARWTAETFHFSSNGQSDIGEPTPNDDLKYESLKDALIAVNIPVDIVPSYIPDDYSLIDITIEETPLKRAVISSYESGRKILKIHVQSYLNSDPEQVEQGGYSETYPLSGTVFYIYSNYDQAQVSWTVDSYECHISGDLTIDELKVMIESIGKD